jgi:hypothetical protein
MIITAFPQIAGQRVESPVFRGEYHLDCVHLQRPGQLMKSGVAVEKRTKPVISANFSACGERTFNNLDAGRNRLLAVGPNT